MTVYCIYKKGNSISDSPFLYAFTEKKNLKDTFLEERKKDMFICKKHDITEKEYKELKSNHGSSLYLTRKGFRTSHTIGEMDIVYMTIILGEDMDVFTNSDKVISEIAKYTDPISRSFNKELLKALDTLEYFNIQKFSSTPTDEDWFLRGVGDYASFDFKGADIRIDEFSLFLYFFGNTIDYDYIMKKR